MGRRETPQEMVARIHAQDAAEAERKAAIREATNKAYRERREAEKAAKAQQDKEREAERQAERAAEFDRRHKRPARNAFLRTGGTVEEFDKAWPEMRERIRQDVIATEVEQRRRVSMERARQTF